MRVLLKVLLIVVVVVGLCAAAAVIAIRFLPETDLIRDSLQGTLHELTGHNVLLGALKTSLSLRGPLRLTVEGVSVTSRSGVNLLSADTVELAPSLASLWERKVSIQTIHIHGLRMVVRRDASGRLVDFVPPEAVTTSGQTPSPERAEDRSRTPHQTGTTSKEPSSGGIDTGIRWSVDSIRLVGGQIDWIDQRGSGGQETRISLKNINGSLERKEGGSAVLTRITGELAGSKGQGGTVTLDGSVAPSPDFTSLVGADLNLRATSLDLKIFQEYGPTAASLQQTFDSADLQARVAWQNETTAKVSFSAQIKSGKIQSAMLKLDGDLTVRDDLSGIRDIRCVAKTDMVPLALLNSIVPRDFPLNTEKGSTKGSVKGEWSAPESWRLAGDIEVENVILTGRFRAVADAVQLSIRGELTPQNLILQNLDVTGARKIASVAGVVSNPLSEARELDLKGELALRAEWLKALGLELPKEVHLNGAVPIRGKLRGKVGDLSVDLAGDLSDAAVRWVPYLEKGQGAAGTISLKGAIVSAQKGSRKEVASQAQVSIRMRDAAFRLNPAGPRIGGCSVNLDSKVALAGKRVDLKDAALTVRRGTPEGNLIAVKADVTDLGTGAAKIQGEANAQFDQNALTLGGFDIGPEISVSGSALLTLKFKGSEAALDWSADLPLKPLEIAKADAFRKPAGVAGDLKASGHWTPEEFTLVAGKLTVPGIVVTSQGKLRDKSGKFPGMTLAAKSARLEEVSKLVPALRDQGLSGPTDITVRLKSSGDAVTADATARVIDVDFRPKNAGWSLEGMAGALEAHGAVLEIPELRGKLKSAVEGPITIKGRLENFTSQEALTGRLAVHVGKGRINPGQLKTLISQANVLLGTLIDPQQKGDRASPLEMDVATGTFQLGSGTARTDDLTLKGPDVSVGAIGTIHLKSATLDAHMGIKTFTLIPSVVGNIPQVRRLMKEHEGLLKALGVDKELKRLGIDSSEPTPGKPEQPAITKTPMTVMLKLNGPASAPNVTPVLEAALDRTMAARLKSLIE